MLDMSRSEFAETFAKDFESVPHAIGVNTHRGSLLTRHPGHMAWLMEEISRRGKLIFIDSYTTNESIALQFARESGVLRGARVMLHRGRRSFGLERRAGWCAGRSCRSGLRGIEFECKILARRL